MRRLLRLGVRLGLLGGIAFAIAKVMQSRRTSDTGVPWVNGVSSRPDLPSPAPSIPTSAAAADTDALAARSRVTPATTTATVPTPDEPAATVLTAPETVADPSANGAAPPVDKAVTGDTIWVEADGTVCPATHPVKAKLSSRLYHLPGMSAYARTRPDRCYPDEESAQADGLTKARR